VLDIENVTIDCFGSQLGGTLLQSGAILPVIGKRPATGISHHNDGVDLSRSYGDFDGLAIINGPLSGILAVDLDDTRLTPPAPFNVVTGKGGHIYTKWDGQRRRIAFAKHVDLLGAGGYCVFFGPGRRFVSANLADSSSVVQWLGKLSPHHLKSLSGDSEGRASTQGVKTESVGREYKHGAYAQKLDWHGYELRVENISKRYASAMSNAEEGTRNDRLYRYSLEVYRCGADADALAAAAHVAGLAYAEIEATMASALADLELDYRPETEMFERVQAWLSYYSELPEVMASIATELAFEAVACNTSRPLLSQCAVGRSIGRHQTYVGKALDVMEKHGAVKKYPNEGAWGERRLRHCNNYALTIEGVEI
jgi:hypothetical protein